MNRRVLQQGFTAVELLITLFIASVFLFAGYQLYTQVIRDGKDADRTAKLSNIVYQKMREAAAQVTAAYPSGCTAAADATDSTSSETVPGIGSVSFAKTISCPYGTASPVDIFLVKITATYTADGTQKKVEHATYAS